MGSISLIQLPYDSGRFGERMGRGPIALIEAGLVEHLRSLGNEVDVASVRLSEGLHTETNALVELQRLTVPLLRDALSRQACPIILSGNCGPAALSAVAALNQCEIATIWFDAHADFNTPETSQSGFLDGMGLAILTGRCWRRLAERFENFRPVLDSQVIQIGVRENDPEEVQLLEQSRIKQIPTVALAGLPGALKQLSTNIVYVHVDLDVIDTSEGRANGWACDGGLSVNQLLDALELIGRSASIVAGAVTCYDQLSILTIAWSGDSWHRGVACALGKPPRYQTLIERSITARGFGTEKCYAIAACMTTRDSCRRLLTLNIECLAQIAMPTSSYIRTTRAHSGL